MCIFIQFYDCDLQIRSASQHSPVGSSGKNPAKIPGRCCTVFYVKRNQMYQGLGSTFQKTEMSISGLFSVKSLITITRSLARALMNNKKRS